MSKSINRKHTSRSSLNQSMRIKREKILKSNVGGNVALRKEEMVNVSNSTMRHYSAFSSTKHRAKTNNFLISTAELV